MKRLGFNYKIAKNFIKALRTNTQNDYINKFKNKIKIQQIKLYIKK